MSRVLLAATLVALPVTCGVLVPAATGFAAGTPSLDHLIIADPEHGWTDLPRSETSEFNQEIETELSAKASADQTYTSAVEGWQPPSGSSTSSLVVFLVQVLTGGVGSTPKNLAENFCDGATGMNPGNAPAIVGVPSSAVTSCTGNNLKVTVGTAIDGAYLVIVASAGSSPLTPEGVGQVVKWQRAVLPASTVASGSGSSAPLVIGGIAGGVVILAGVVALVLISRRRRLNDVGQIEASQEHSGSAAATAAHHDEDSLIDTPEQG